MADITNTLPQWSTTASSNAPQDATAVGSGLGDNLRTLQAVIRSYLSHYNAVAIASSATTDLGANTGLFQEISGTATITSLGTVSAGIWKIVRFQNVATLTYSANLVLTGGVNITTRAGDVMLAYSVGSGFWYVPFYQRADGTVPAGFIHNMNADLVPDILDEIPVYDTSDGVNRKMTLQDMLKVINGLPVKVAPSASGDLLYVYDVAAAAPKRATLTSFIASTAEAGVAEFATPTEIIAGTDVFRVMTPGYFSTFKSLAADGYYIFPGGLTVQWGSVAYTDPDETFGFPIAFPSAVWAIAFSYSSGNVSHTGVRLTVLNNSGATIVVNPGSGGSATVYYIAVGV